MWNSYFHKIQTEQIDVDSMKITIPHQLVLNPDGDWFEDDVNIAPFYLNRDIF